MLCFYSCCSVCVLQIFSHFAKRILPSESLLRGLWELSFYCSHSFFIFTGGINRILSNEKNITNVPLSILRHAFQNMSKSAFDCHCEPACICGCGNLMLESSIPSVLFLIPFSFIRLLHFLKGRKSSQWQSDVFKTNNSELSHHRNSLTHQHLSFHIINL